MTPKEALAETRPKWYHCPDCGEPHNYEPNTIKWPPGSLVVHDYDAKQPAMLMVVLGYTVKGECRTRYINTHIGSSPLTRKEWRHPICVLHDPKRFNIETPKE